MIIVINNITQINRRYINKLRINKTLNCQTIYNFSNNKSFIDVPQNNPFPIQNIPFGVFNTGNGNKNQIGVAIGEYILNVSELSKNGYFKEFSKELQNSLQEETLNKFFQQQKSERVNVRKYIQELLGHKSTLANRNEYILNQKNVKMQLPVCIGDYTDFYASRCHAENVGEMFRGKDNKLMPNWLHMPIGYHGRSSSVNVDDKCVRPRGQIDLGKFGPEGKLDFELEVAMIFGGKGNQMGSPIDIKEASDCIAGYCIMNDLSARMIQRIEYVPLGPFLGKNFSTVISPWVVTPEALEIFRIKRPPQPDILPYLKPNQLNFYDIPLHVHLKPNQSQKTFQISESNMSNLYWNFEQMIAHHSISGCNMRAGDMLGSGTISGEDSSKNGGSLLELSWNGQRQLDLDGIKRSFLENGDTIILSGGKQIPGTNQFLGFGSISTTIIDYQ